MGNLKMKKSFAILFFGIFLIGFVSATDYYVTESMPQIIKPNSWNPVAQPGDTIIIFAERVSPIIFENFNGTSEKKYTFTNPLNAKVEINASGSTGIQFRVCDNFILRGDNYPSEIYGIVINGDGIGGGVRIWQGADWMFHMLR